MTDKKPKTCQICGSPYFAKGLCRKHYHQRQEYKAKQREYYHQHPEIKAKQKEYYQRPEIKAKQREYHQRPEIKAKQRERKKNKKIVRQYHALMLVKKPTRLQVLRLSALADILGRDLEEWRTEKQKEVWL